MSPKIGIREDNKKHSNKTSDMDHNNIRKLRLKKD
jgi:hypothetical protein